MTIVPKHITAITLLPQERLFVGIDIGRHSHYAGFVSKSLLEKHRHPEKCPSRPVLNSRTDFEALVEEMATYAPLSDCVVLVEKTGHYHVPLLYFLQSKGITVYTVHVRKRPRQKTDRRDALMLANTVYSQVGLGAQCSEKKEEVHLAHEPSEHTAELRTLTRRRYEIGQSCTKVRNRLTAVCDELFPEFGIICKGVNGPTALRIRQTFPTPQSLAEADMADLKACRGRGHWPSNAALQELQELAQATIGVKNPGRVRGLAFEQRHLIAELQLLEGELSEAEAEIERLIAESREGQILASMPAIGLQTAANLIGAIGSIANFESASKLKGFLGWAPEQQQTGTSQDSTKLTKGGLRMMRKELYLCAWRAVEKDTEWAIIYEGLVERLCGYDARKDDYIGKNRVIGRIAGQMINMVYSLLRRDYELLRRLAPGETPPPPELYDRSIHRAHRLSGLAKRNKRNV